VTGEAEAFSLIRTKLQAPRLPADLIRRRRLVDRLAPQIDQDLTETGPMRVLQTAR
jgi:ATP/maltotriose-dependent transcriptional regulator MalT